jgi:hypothetical protein
VSADDAPMYYIDQDGVFTYDELTISGARTCSLTLTDKEQSSETSLFYEPFAELKNRTAIVFGMHMRAVNIVHAEFYIEFYDGGFKKINTLYEDVTSDIGHNFSKIGKFFKPPEASVYFKPGLKICGNVTALTIFYPFAY